MSTFPSKTPTTKLSDSYSFRVYDFANTKAEQIDHLNKLIAPFAGEGHTFINKRPEVILIDEAHRAPKPIQDSTLTSLDGRLYSSVIVCVAEINLPKLDVGLRRRWYPLHIVPPGPHEMLAYAELIAEKESISVGEKAALRALARGARGLPSNVLLMLEMALVQRVSITQSWVERMLPRLPPEDEKEPKELNGNDGQGGPGGSPNA